MKKLSAILSALCLFSLAAVAQVAISNDGSNAAPNTMLDIKSGNKGVKFPRLTTAQRKAISVTTADAGLMLFDTDKQALYMYDGNEWLPFAVATNPVDLLKKKMPGLNSPMGNFGYACAVSGDYAVIGAYNDSVGNVWSPGSAYTYKKINGNWALQSRITAWDGIADAKFGKAVAMEGDYIAVGAEAGLSGAGIATGAVYIFKRNGDAWLQQAKLTAVDGAVSYRFGYSLALEGNVLVVGAPNAKVGINADQGAVYVFTRTVNNWSQQKLIAPDGMATNYFGVSVAISNNDIVAGASRGNYGKGAAYIFTKANNTWIFQKELETDYTGTDGYFGVSVAVSGDVIVVGASQETFGNFIKTGIVHIFKRNNNYWYHTSVEMPLTRKDNIHFGLHVALKNNTLFVTAQNEDVSDFAGQGTVYVYKWNSNNYFNMLKRITDPDGAGNEQFGTCIAFDGSTYVTGSPMGQRVAGSSAGGMVFFGSIE